MKKLLIAICILCWLGSCTSNKYTILYPADTTVSTTCDTTAIKYAADIAPIITANCSVSGGCHNAAGDAVTNNLDFTIFATLQGQATTAIIVADINGTPGRGHAAMPLHLPKISNCDINKITRWVNEGAPNN
jgi:dissimilatory sulfite reductase (desulfoviridin) alpha/beta subunit